MHLTVLGDGINKLGLGRVVASLAKRNETAVGRIRYPEIHQLHLRIACFSSEMLGRHLTARVALGPPDSPYVREVAL